MNPSKKMRLDTSHRVALSGGMKWHCPICMVVPFKEIYSCSKGHSLCSLCSSQIQKCPKCNVDFGEEKQRNFGLEELLDLLKLKCIWDSCSEELSRGDVSEHEEKCYHNPNAINMCYIFGEEYGNCNFRFTQESLQDPHKVEQLLVHFKCSHDKMEIKFPPGHNVAGTFYLDNEKCPGSNSKGKYEIGVRMASEILSMDHDNKKHLFIRYTKIDIDNETGEEMFSFMLVQLTPDLSPHKSSFYVNLFIKGCSKSTNLFNKEDPSCVATTHWEFKPIKINEFLENFVQIVHVFVSPVSPFRIPISQLQEYYVGSNGEINFGFTIFIN